MCQLSQYPPSPPVSWHMSFCIHDTLKKNRRASRANIFCLYMFYQILNGFGQSPPLVGTPTKGIQILKTTWPLTLRFPIVLKSYRTLKSYRILLNVLKSYRILIQFFLWGLKLGQKYSEWHNINWCHTLELKNMIFKIFEIFRVFWGGGWRWRKYKVSKIWNAFGVSFS